MSYIDSKEFQDKAADFRAARDAQRQAYGRRLFDEETAGTADEVPPAEFLAKLKDA